ncbi:GAP1-N1 domain-containing protein [Vibrio cholerae]|uniref:GAP1-N1 domain-containing protein n=1 Tax=Vibrio cholerae TaxID=666 RepID=UPI0030197126
MINFPIEALYGFVKHGHGLISCEGELHPPSVLSGLTDKPSGHVNPVNKWWPAINCGPIDNEWWAIWSIEPDQEAPRGGMVKTKVLLWPLSEIGDLHDISPFVSQLIGTKTTSNTPDSALTNILNELSSAHEAIVVNEQFLIPDFISRLWPKLWQKAKQEFSVRTAFLPPQSILTSTHPTIYVTPNELSNQWKKDGLKIVNTRITRDRTRVDNYLLDGEKDSFLSDIIQKLDNLPGSLKMLSGLSRLANNLEKYRSNRSFDNALSTLRTAIAYAQKEKQLIEIKEELLRTLKKELPNTSNYLHPLSLSNINEESLPIELLPKQELTGWIKSNILNIDVDSVESFLSRTSGNFQSWWKECVLEAIAIILNQDRVNKQIIYWLKINTLNDTIKTLGINGSTLGEKVFDAVNNNKFTKDEYIHSQNWAERYKCSKLHAWAILNSDHNCDIFKAHYEAISNDDSGIIYLIENIDARMLGDAICDERLKKFSNEIAKRALKTPDLLNFIDLSKSPCLEIWSLQLEQGGTFYPPKISTSEFNKTISNLINEIKSNIVFDIVINTIIDHYLTYDNRSKIWEKLSLDRREKLARKLSSHIFSGRDYRFEVMIHEKEIISALDEEFNSAKVIDGNILINYLSKNIIFNESNISSWIQKVNSNDWIECATSLGVIVKKNSWSSVANNIFDLSCGFFATTPKLKPAIQECSDLLHYFNQVTYRFLNGAPSSEDRNAVIGRFADECSEIAHNKLEYYWKKAGGNLKTLSLTNSPSQNWLDAAQKAESGMLAGGLLTLVEVVLSEFPNNPKLNHIKIILSK